LPPPEPDQVRYVMTLPREAAESAIKVELVVDNNIQTDAGDTGRRALPNPLQQSPADRRLCL
jgi:serine protease inhibitor ecotin